MRESTVHKSKLLKASEIAAILNISRAFAYKLIKNGDIPAVQIGASLRVRPSDLEAYIESHLGVSNDLWE